MNVYRATTCCPICRDEQETWNYKGVYVPNNLTQCFNCDTIFQTDNYISSFLALRANATVSTTHIRNLINF